jgi:hypothetical protein
MNWQIAKQAGLLLVVAIPALFILTRLSAWAIGRFRRRADALVSPVFPESGYETPEDFRREAEELSVSDVLEKANGLAPEKAPAAAGARAGRSGVIGAGPGSGGGIQGLTLIRGMTCVKGGAPVGPNYCLVCRGLRIVRGCTGTIVCSKCNGSGREA